MTSLSESAKEHLEKERPQEEQIAPPERAIVIVPHPDDADFLAAGTIARWVKEGIEVTLVVITDGSKGSEDPDLTPDKLIAERRIEQKRAAGHLGIHNIIFLDYEDGTLQDTIPLRRDLSKIIRQLKPERAICMDPTMRYSLGGYVNHPDHVASGNAALAAIYPLARNRPSFRSLLADGLEPHSVKHLYLGATENADVWVDISETIDQKVAALREHASQLNIEEIEPMIRAWAEGDARNGVKHFEKAEPIPEGPGSTSSPEAPPSAWNRTDAKPLEMAESFKYLRLA